MRTVENTVNKHKGNQRMKKKKSANKDNYVDASEAQFLFQLSMKGGVPSTVQAAIKSAQAKMGAGIT